MTSIGIVEREMTEAELSRVKARFDEHAAEHGNPGETSERFGFIAMDGDKSVGCSSGLAYPRTTGYGNWFYLTDLFIEKMFRGRGLGAELLRKLEERVILLGIGNIWTWTAGFEAPGFYRKQGYETLSRWTTGTQAAMVGLAFGKRFPPDHRSNQAFEATS